MVRATTNPYGSGHHWVKDRFALHGRWWDNIVQENPLNSSGQVEQPRVAIYGHIDENKILLKADPEYKKTIIASASNPAMAEAWLAGSWDIVAGGMFGDVWKAKFNIVRRFIVPLGWRLDRSFDWGSSKPFSVGWWAQSDGSDLRFDSGDIVSTVRGDLFRIKEWYGWTGQPNQGLHMLATEVAKGVVEREMMWGWRRDSQSSLVRPGPADSSIYTVENGVSIANDMARPVRIGDQIHKGVSWTQADKRPGSRKTGWEMIRKMMKAAWPIPGRPRETAGLFVVGEECPQFLRTVIALARLEKDMDDIDTDAEDHIADEARYRIRAVGNVAKSGTHIGMY